MGSPWAGDAREFLAKIEVAAQKDGQWEWAYEARGGLAVLGAQFSPRETGLARAGNEAVRVAVMAMANHMATFNPALWGERRFEDRQMGAGGVGSGDGGRRGRRHR